MEKSNESWIYANLFKGILSNKLDSSKKEFEGFIDIFTKAFSSLKSRRRVDKRVLC